jgi:2-phosphoglycerate kinase
MSERRYLAPLPLGGDEWPPFSKGLMARALAATGLPLTRAYELARRADADLQERNADGLDLDRLADLAVEVLDEPDASRTIRRLRRLQAVQNLDLPIVLLVGGATGTGKSTVATEVAHVLGITRVTSTDFIRQTIRAFFSERSMPSVHHSSFEGDPVLVGFLDQTRNVLVGVDAAIDRALAEGWSMVLEGVHLVPGMMPSEIEGTIVVHTVLAVDSLQVHRTRFHLRDELTGGVRAMDKYLDQLYEIRQIQDYLVERAARHRIPVIESSNIERATTAVLELVLASADRAHALA